MRLAFLVLRWPPEAVWRATPRELMAAIDTLMSLHGLQPPTSGDLAMLMQVFPDNRQKDL